MFLPLTKSELLALWRKIFPRGYTEPIENQAGGQGLDAFAQQAAQFENVAEAANVTTQAYYLRFHSTQTAPPAQGALASVGQLSITRLAPANGPITIIQGTEFIETRRNPDGVVVEGERFRSTADAVFVAGDLGPVLVPVQNTRVGYQGNMPPESITNFALRGTASVAGTVYPDGAVGDGGTPDRFTQAMIGQYVRITTGPDFGTFPRRILSVDNLIPGVTRAILDGPALTVGSTPQIEVEEFADLGLSVAQNASTTGGRHGWLDAIGQDRGILRQQNEPDNVYRARLVDLPDVVSPAAILRIAARVFTPLGLSYRLLETRGPGLLGFIWDESPYDVGDLCSGNVLLDANDAVRFFVLCVEIGNQGEFGAPYDTPFANNAWDVLAFDGYPVDYLAALGAVYSAIENARAAGIHWTLVRDPNL